MDIETLTARQRFSLWLEGREGLATAGEAARFLADVSIALRYGASPNLPLASMYRATQRQVPQLEGEKTAHARAFDLTNQLLASRKAVEINVVADRLALVSPGLLPAIYALRRRQAERVLSEAAREAFAFITSNAHASSGEVRRHLKVPRGARPNAADLALAELQRALLIDRGPSRARGDGVFYLSRDGYPYRVLATAHPELVSAAAALDRPDASRALLERYLAGALFATPRKLATLFQLLLDPEEVDATIESLVDRGRLQRVRLGRAEMVLSGGEST